MGGRMLRAALVCLGLLVAGAAFAQQSGDGSHYLLGGDNTLLRVGGMSRTDSLKYMLSMTPGGSALYTQEYAPNRDNVVQFEQIISSSLVGGTADSSAVMNVHGLRHLKLLLKFAVQTAGVLDTLSTVRFAIQFREHLNGLSDTTSTFAEYRVNQLLETTAARDTLNFGQLLSGGGGTPFSGEFCVSYSLNRQARGGVAAAPLLFTYPNGIAVLCDRIFGSDAWWNKLSIRIRNLSPKTITVTAHLVGVSL